MDSGIGLRRNNKKAKFKGYNEQEVMESRNYLRPEGDTAHKEEVKAQK